MHARLLRRCSVVRDVYPNAQTCGNAQLPPLAGTSLPIARTLCANSERRADKLTNATRAPRTSSQQRACPTLGLCIPVEHAHPCKQVTDTFVTHPTARHNLGRETCVRGGVAAMWLRCRVPVYAFAVCGGGVVCCFDAQGRGWGCTGKDEDRERRWRGRRVAMTGSSKDGERQGQRED